MSIGSARIDDTRDTGLVLWLTHARKNVVVVTVVRLYDIINDGNPSGKPLLINILL